MEKVALLSDYMQAWCQQDDSRLDCFFTEDIYYSECYGPVYQGLIQVKQWFRDWNKQGKVEEWTIQRTLEVGKTLVAQWHFSCVYDGLEHEFDGVTIADFEGNKIKKLLEFQSDSEHTYPYSR